MQATTALTGSIRRFGADGVLYEVIRELDASTALIRVVETGEETRYPIADIRSDPIE